MNKTFRKVVISIIVTIFIMSAAGVAGYFFGLKPWIDSARLQLATYQSTIGMSMHTILVATHDLKAGDILSDGDVYEKETYISNTADLITYNDLGKTLLINIPAEEIVYERDLIEPTANDTERRVQYSCFAVSEGMNPGTWIDVRIRFQNGEDYCVLSKKMIDSIDLETSTCFLTVDKTEIVRMASAIVDANIFNGYLYSTAYTLGTIQEASEVTYLPSYSDPEFRRAYFNDQMVAARDDLISRLTEYANTVMKYEIGLDISNQAGTSTTKETSNDK